MADDLRARLMQLAEGWRRQSVDPSNWLKEEFVVRIGVACTAQPLPRSFRQGPPHECFDNAAKLARNGDGLRYCEGFAAHPKAMVPFHHAWTVDDDFRVIDVTLQQPETYAYLGVPFSQEEYLAETGRTLDGYYIGTAILVDTTGLARPEPILRRCPELRELL